MPAYLGTPGRLIPLATSTSPVTRTSTASFSTTLSGRRVAQMSKHPGHRQWTVSRDGVTPEEWVQVNRFEAGVHGVGPFIWVDAWSAANNALSRRESILQDWELPASWERYHGGELVSWGDLEVTNLFTNPDMVAGSGFVAVFEGLSSPVWRGDPDLVEVENGDGTFSYFGTPVEGVSALRGVVVQSSQWAKSGGVSARFITTSEASGSNIPVAVGSAIGSPVGGVVVWRRQDAPIGEFEFPTGDSNLSILTAAGDASDPAVNAPGETLMRIELGETAPNGVQVYLPGGGNVGDSVWFDILTITDESYDGPPFSGSSRPYMGRSYRWAGTPNESASEARVNTQAVQVPIVAEGSSGTAALGPLPVPSGGEVTLVLWAGTSATNSDLMWGFRDSSDQPLGSIQFEGISGDSRGWRRVVKTLQVPGQAAYLVVVLNNVYGVAAPQLTYTGHDPVEYALGGRGLVVLGDSQHNPLMAIPGYSWTSDSVTLSEVGMA